MRLPDPTFEESFEEERALRYATCDDCKNLKPIPVAYGDPHYGYCPEEDDYMSGCARLKDTECKAFKWRKW